MNKIAPLLLVLSLNTYFSSGVLAADGSCAALLGAADDLSVEKRSTADQLSSYLKELFDQGVVTEQELISFRDGLIRGEHINPIENPELDINRYIAFEKIVELLRVSTDRLNLIESLGPILKKVNIDSNVRDIVNEDVRMMFFITTATREELIDFIENYFSKPESKRNHRELRVAIERTDKKDMPLYARNVFSKEHWAGHPELLRLAIAKTANNYMFDYAEYVFSKPHWANHPELLRLALIKKGKDVNDEFIKRVFSEEHWAGYPDLLRFSIENAPLCILDYYKTYVFSKPYWSSYTDLEAALRIMNDPLRIAHIRSLGPYPWEGTEQENLEEYLNKLYGRIDE